jgi:hypothetical protein
VLAGSVHPDEFSSLTNTAAILMRAGLMPRRDVRTGRRIDA